VREGRLDIGPLDAYWHLLIARHAPQLTEGIRVLASTELAPIPAFCDLRRCTGGTRRALRTAFVGAASQPWFARWRSAVLDDSRRQRRRSMRRYWTGTGKRRPPLPLPA